MTIRFSGSVAQPQTGGKKVHDRNPDKCEKPSAKLEETCGDIPLESVQGRIQHARGYFPRCLTRANIACDVNVDFLAWCSLHLYIYIVVYITVVFHPTSVWLTLQLWNKTWNSSLELSVLFLT